MDLNRREVLKIVSLATGYALVGSERLGNLAFAKPGVSFLSKADITLLDEVGETIIPTTDTPGAKATKIGEFMNIMVRDCYTKEQQLAFTTGLAKFKPFSTFSNEKRRQFIADLEAEASAFNDSQMAKRDGTKVPSLHYYTMIKQLTIFGYFTSEIGATQALRHVAIPGRYDGAFPYKKGDRAFNDDV